MSRFTNTSYIYLPASLLEEQEYCELKLHYKIVEGKGAPLRPGEARRVVREAIVKMSNSNFSGVPGFMKVSVAGDILGVPVAASPDAAVTDSDGLVRALLRGRLRNPLKTYDSDYTKLIAAAYLLEKAGRLAEDARLAILVGRNPRDLKSLVELVVKEGIKPYRGEEGIVEVRVYRAEEAARLLDNLMAYWRGERDPIARPSPNKCAICNYALRCPHAAIKPL